MLSRLSGTDSHAIHFVSDITGGGGGSQENVVLVDKLGTFEIKTPVK